MGGGQPIVAESWETTSWGKTRPAPLPRVLTERIVVHRIGHVFGETERRGEYYVADYRLFVETWAA
jgi:hypothetical protein